MCPVLSHWENGQEGCEEVHDGPSTSSTIEREWRQSLPKKLEKAEVPPDSGQGNSFCNPLTKKRGYSKLVNEYYEKQNEILSQFSDLDTFEERMLLNADAMQREREKTDKAERLAIQLSNIANVLLFALKVYASIASRSLAIIASTLDSLLDMLSGFILWYTARSMRRVNPYKYPIGKKRMQPLGIIVFASIMAMLGLQVLVEAARDFFSSDHSFHLNSLPWVVGVMVGVTAVKLGLFLLCRLYDNEIVQAYAKDHFFDVVTNSLGLAAALLADRFEWWIDPTGAIVLALYTIVNWSGTVRENVQSLVGQSAPPEFLAKITYLCWNHHRDILQIDTVRAYVFGSHMFAEVDIVLPGSMPLREAHDIGEALQNKLELLPEIERAFVHLDFEVSHKPEHNLVPAKGLVPPTPGRAQASADAESAAVAESV